MPQRKTGFANLGVTELLEMRAQIERFLSKKIAAERDELQTRLDALDAFEPGHRAATNGRGRGRRSATARNGRRRAHPLKGRKAPIKYRGPNGEKWSGRGLAPRWLAALENKGKKRESYLV